MGKTKKHAKQINHALWKLENRLDEIMRLMEAYSCHIQTSRSAFTTDELRKSMIVRDELMRQMEEDAVMASRVIERTKDKHSEFLTERGIDLLGR